MWYSILKTNPETKLKFGLKLADYGYKGFTDASETKGVGGYWITKKTIMYWNISYHQLNKRFHAPACLTSTTKSTTIHFKEMFASTVNISLHNYLPKQK